MGLGRREAGAKHETAGIQRFAATSSETQWLFKPGQRVMTCDDLPGVVSSVEDGPYAGNEEYHVTLDNSMGGGRYTASQLRPEAKTEASIHTADQDYPELGSILYDRPDIAVNQVLASRTARAATHHSLTEDGQACTRCGRDFAVGGNPGADPCDPENWAGSFEHKMRREMPEMASAGAELAQQPIGPSHLSSHQHPEGTQDCNEGEAPGIDEHGHLTWGGDSPACGDTDSYSMFAKRILAGRLFPCRYCEAQEGGAYDLGGHCGHCASDPASDWEAHHHTEDEHLAAEQNAQDEEQNDRARQRMDDFTNHVETSLGGMEGHTFHVNHDTGEYIGKVDDKHHFLADDGSTVSLAPDEMMGGAPEHAGDRYGHCYKCDNTDLGGDAYHDWQDAGLRGLRHEVDNAVPHETQREIFQQYDRPTVAPTHMSSLDPYTLIVEASEDSDFRFEITASWSDVRSKAKRLRTEGRVRILAASDGVITAEVKGDHHIYETQIQRLPGQKMAVAIWQCGCKWAAYSWGRSDAFKRFEGRMCSHALALQFEAQSRGMFGRDITPDAQRPDWLKAHSPVVIEYDKTKDRNLTRREVPPANMKRVFTSALATEDTVLRVALAEMLSNGADVDEVSLLLSTALLGDGSSDGSPGGFAGDEMEDPESGEPLVDDENISVRSVHHEGFLPLLLEGAEMLAGAGEAAGAAEGAGEAAEGANAAGAAAGHGQQKADNGQKSWNATWATVLHDVHHQRTPVWDMDPEPSEEEEPHPGTMDRLVDRAHDAFEEYKHEPAHMRNPDHPEAKRYIPQDWHATWATLNDFPEPALPATDGAEDDPETMSVAPAGGEDDRVASLHTAESVDDIVAAFQANIDKTALKDFTPGEQFALIHEGEGDRARNFDRLKIEGTHYEALEAALAAGEDDASDLF